MERARICERLGDLTQLARERQGRCDGIFAATVGGAGIDFMTTEELQERHELMLQMPTAAEERDAARLRIQARIAERKARRGLHQVPKGRRVEDEKPSCQAAGG